MPPAACSVLREELERLDVQGADDPEVAAVKGRDRCRVKPLRRGDDRGVDGAKRQVAVGADELGDPFDIGGMELFDQQVPGGERAENADLGLPAQSGGGQLHDLGDAENRNDQRTRIAVEELRAGRVMVVLDVEIREQRSRVD
jgi:hypothetical protein